MSSCNTIWSSGIIWTRIRRTLAPLLLLLSMISRPLRLYLKTLSRKSLPVNNTFIFNTSKTTRSAVTIRSKILAKHLSTRHLLFYKSFFLLFCFPYPIHSITPCFPLNGSKACPEVAGYSITPGSYLTFYTFLTSVDNITAFDDAIKAYVNNTAQYAAVGCPSVPPARFTLTLVCADLVNDPISQTCSESAGGKKSPGICAQTCDDFHASLGETLGNKTLCPGGNGSQLGDLAQRLDSLCQKPDGDGDCISGAANENTTCGTLIGKDF